MCEFLIYAKVQWMEEVPQEIKDGWDKHMWDKHNRRLVKGNLIVVKPDGWKWGKLECPPDFVVVKVFDMTVEEGEKYLNSWEREVKFKELSYDDERREWGFEVSAKPDSVSGAELITLEEQMGLDIPSGVTIKDSIGNKITFDFQAKTLLVQYNDWINDRQNWASKEVIPTKIEAIGYNPETYEGYIKVIRTIGEKQIESIEDRKFTTEEGQRNHFIEAGGIWCKTIRRKRWQIPKSFLIHNSIINKITITSQIIDRKTQLKEDLI